VSESLFGDMQIIKATKQEIGKAIELLCPECGGELFEVLKGEVAECERDKILFQITRGR